VRRIWGVPDEHVPWRIIVRDSAILALFLFVILLPLVLWLP